MDKNLYCKIITREGYYDRADIIKKIEDNSCFIYFKNDGTTGDFFKKRKDDSSKPQFMLEIPMPKEKKEKGHGQVKIYIPNSPEWKETYSVLFGLFKEVTEDVFSDQVFTEDSKPKGLVDLFSDI